MNRKMNIKFLISVMFIIWVATITVLAVIPHADDGIMVASNVTPSGMEKHLVGYFIATLLCYYAYGKKEEGGKRAEVVFVWLSGLLIFLYSVVLESVQFFLSYRTFNPYDIVANGSGIFLFVIIQIYRLRSARLPW